MKNFKIREELRPFLKDVLSRRNISFIDRPASIKADCSGRQYHLALTRARCEFRNKAENLSYDQTYIVRKIEKETDVHAENSEYIRFLDM